MLFVTVFVITLQQRDLLNSLQYQHLTYYTKNVPEIAIHKQKQVDEVVNTGTLAPYGSSVNVDPVVGVVNRPRDVHHGCHEVSKSDEICLQCRREQPFLKM